ncbi:MAG TPA: LuxR C-terminal-related transcriptional regulator [Clostridia bacterium]|nr:LuxR C-terminal-related transcriptional regulator [Clostridia bacterium]
MALFEQLKKLIASGQQRSIEKDVAAPHGTVRNSDSHSFAGKAGQTEEEKRERFSRLTPRENELCLLLLEGFTLRESAKQLSIKYSTANTHMTGIYKKLCVRSRAELIINYRDISIAGSTQEP